ncbi:hypothetical protein ElyMa_003361400 [Elysia marginata]|uniref:Uncharacterized protein n=1 Tax=Elysia marginata TaxID=1093978 RepID=A0AAV4JLT4_9GAST|nr:hypothetical protein ElyMa_003361400 [Elysia marginata]
MPAMEPEIMGYSQNSSAFNTLNASDDSTLNAPVESVAVNGLNRRASVEADNVESLQQTLDDSKTNDKNVFKRFKELWLIKKIMAFFQCIFCCSASGKKPENAASAPLPDSNGPTISIVVHECSDPVEPPLVVVSDVPQSVETSHVVGEEVLQDSDDREQLVESEVRTDPGADPSVTAVRDTELQSSAVGNAETVEMSQDREQLNEMAHMGEDFDGMEDFSNDGQPVSLQRAHGQQPEFLSLLSTISERTEPVSLASSTQTGGSQASTSAFPKDCPELPNSRKSSAIRVFNRALDERVSFSSRLHSS